MEDDVIEVQGEKIKYILRKPKVGDWKEYYKKRKEIKETYENDQAGEYFGMSVFMIERCLVEPKINVDDIPFSDFSLLNDALFQSSIPRPLPKKGSPMT